MTIQKSLSPATNHSLKDIDFYKNFTNNMSTASTGKMEGLSPSHDQTDASALAAAAAAAHAHLNGTMQDMINLQKLQNLATLQHQHNQQQQQQHNQQQSDSPVAVPPVAAALASLQGLAGISSAVPLNSPLNLSIGSTTSAATAVANLSSSTGPTNSINNNKPHGPLGSTSTSSSSPLPVSSLSISITGSTATSPPHGGDTIAGVGNSPVASNLIAGGCSPPAASAQMPQLILASGQLVQGVQGAQLLIPTAQGIAVQTILTIPVSQQINTNEQFGKFATPLPPPPQSQSLLKPNLFSNGVQQLLAALHPELFAAAAANHLANAADAHHHHQHAAVAAAAAAAKSFHMQQIKQEQQRDQQSQAHRASQQFQHLHHQHQQLQSTDNHHLSPKLEATTINSRHSPSPPLHQFNSSSPCGRSPSMSPQPPAGSSQANMPLHLKQSPNRDCSAGINLSHQQQTAKSPVSPALMALSSGGNGNNCPSASNHYSSSPMSSHLFRSHSPAGSQHLTSMSTPSPSNIQHQSREQQQREHQIASASSVLSSINRLTSTNGELTITKSHGPSTTQSSSLSPPHHQSSSLTSQSQSQHHQQQPNSHHPLHSGGVGGHHPHLHSGGNSLKMSPSSSSSVGMQQQQQISPNGTDGSGTDLLVDSPHEQTINQATSNVVDGIDLDEIKEFAKAFKLRRLSLGLTQTQVGQALSVTEGPAYSQSAICSALAAQMYAAQLSSQQQNMFEKLDITPKSAQKIKPVLERWMKEAEESHWNRYKTGQNHLTDYIGVEPSKKRKRRTSFTPQALELLNAHFERNTHPSGTEITGLAHQLGYEREVIRIWFCNKRQALKNTVRMMSKGMV
ncbi:POU domain, class 6, transcription factor 2 isoform X2 [Eupeodes corollae]|nr:POU domain, class 6, transcription factor 2 isoform X2 [Eupeodes corollae]